jgi:hypothetical protein
MSDKPHHPLAGATGRFPQGKQNADDQGELRVAARADRAANLVILDFGKPVAWLSVGPDGARQIALTLLRLASQLDGQILTVKTE